MSSPSIQTLPTQNTTATYSVKASMKIMVNSSPPPPPPPVALKNQTDVAGMITLPKVQTNEEQQNVVSFIPSSSSPHSQPSSSPILQPDNRSIHLPRTPHRISRRISRGRSRSRNIRTRSVQDVKTSKTVYRRQVVSRTISESSLIREPLGLGSASGSASASTLVFEKREIPGHLGRTMSNLHLDDRGAGVCKTERLAERVVARQVVQDMRGMVVVESDEEIDDVGIEMMIRRRRTIGVSFVPMMGPVIKTMIHSPAPPPPPPAPPHSSIQPTKTSSHTLEMVLEEIRAKEMAGSLTETEVSVDDDDVERFERSEMVGPGMVPKSQPCPTVTVSQPSVDDHHNLPRLLNVQIDDYVTSSSSSVVDIAYPPRSPTTSPCHKHSNFPHHPLHGYQYEANEEEVKCPITLGAISEDPEEEVVNDPIAIATATATATATTISSSSSQSDSEESQLDSENEPKSFVPSFFSGSLSLKDASAVVGLKFSFPGSFLGKSNGLVKEQETTIGVDSNVESTASYDPLNDPLPDGSLGWYRPKAQWKQNHMSTNCDYSLYNLCDAPFGIFQRRHHCRMCGGIFCQEHSSNKLLLAMPSYIDVNPAERLRSERVCQACWDDVHIPGKGAHRTKWPKNCEEVNVSVIEVEQTPVSTEAIRPRIALARYYSDPAISLPPRSPSSADVQRTHSTVTGVLATYPLASCRPDGSVSSPVSPSPGSLARSTSSSTWQVTPQVTPLGSTQGSTVSLMDLGRSKSFSKDADFVYEQWGYNREIFNDEAESDEELENYQEGDEARMKARKYLIVDGPISYTVNALPRQSTRTFTWPLPLPSTTTS